ncbi:hypothetical protein BBO99_00002816 [Phytophthora kernoviae]|uniref:non-specific serine/threonine protein kinase n=2 Tax=Phytophthora kernoviae TaxID=325452 RepID=A0A421GVK4_9STRA|nr:hypothetical protein G195_004457 [Phytophthora kernoviae 00238/432]KAG2526311.1 hypothetical protein JM16_003931 [Phytophthora kernoviae]KAG2527887.1 hypothetical protein JM18_003463 [Phytophthora kernoviae]RLN05805.1 hypothetical protein BBI17_002996 [Phytophthora kernoviae]RLN82542.1 hypothetical protein BBO99_00002816 [Phytophthora kernoviae]
MIKPSASPVRSPTKTSAISPVKPGQSTTILPLSRCLSTPVQNGKPVGAAASPTPTARRQERKERTSSGLFERSNPFDTDFCEKELLAQGGFGKIYKCKSNSDGRWYAVKLEQFWFKPETYFNPSEVRDVMMNEALVLAGLDHENVCRYYNTWVLGSLIPAVNKGQDLEPLESPSASPTYTLTRRTSSPSRSSSISGQSGLDSLSETTGEDDEVDMRSSNYSSAYTYDHDDDGVASFNDLGFEMEESEEDGLDISPRLSLARSQGLVEKASPSQRLERDDKILNRQKSFEQNRIKSADSFASTSGAFITQIDVYIQMALYEGNTLRDWMDAREPGEIDAAENMHIFQQIVNGLKYIHKQGLVHRDIKPANIFLTRESCVKIGDFGLSKNTLQTSLHLRPSRYFCEEGDDSLSSLSFGTDAEMEEVSEFSAGVGTPLYSSPEQTHGSHASAAPSDVYSLGILLCELYCTFSTQMERYVVLNNARKGLLPPSVDADYPEVAALIRAMVQEVPLERPTCAKILECNIFQHSYQKVILGIHSPCNSSVTMGPTTHATSPKPFYNATVVNLLRSISRLEREQWVIDIF